MANYKLELTSIELDKINIIKRKETRKTAMMVYSKMKKYANESTGAVYRTISDILKLINRNFELSKTHLYRILKTLKELELITSEKSNYYLSTFISKKEVVENKVYTIKDIEKVRGTAIESFECAGQVDIDEVLKVKDHSNHEVVAPVELVKVANETIETLGYKKKDKELLKTLVSQKLRNCLNVNRIGMGSYLNTVIQEKLTIMINNKQRLNIEGYNNKRVTHANFTQREYDYYFLENQLLGWNE